MSRLRQPGVSGSSGVVLRPDHHSSLPLHAQAEQWLRGLIQQRAYRNGGLLPEEVSLARVLGISRNTLRAAIGRLVAEGWLERQAGVGTRVIEPRAHSAVDAWHSFTREMEAKGVQVDTHAITGRFFGRPGWPCC